MVAMMAEFCLFHSVLKKGNCILTAEQQRSQKRECSSHFWTFSGMIWARFTWGAWWTNDPKLNGSAITILIIWLISFCEMGLKMNEKKQESAPVYNIFAFVMMIVFIGILPRMTTAYILVMEVIRALTHMI